MKKLLLLAFCISMLTGIALSQNKLAEFEQIKKIKIFESTHKDVQKLLPKYFDKNFSLETYYPAIRAEIGYLMIAFSDGNCGVGEHWNIKRGLVTGVSVSNLEGIKLKDLGFNLKNFEKEIEDIELPEDHQYRDEKNGILIEIEDNEVYSVVFYPTENKRAFLCSNESTADIMSGKEDLADTVTVIVCMLVDKPPVINDIILSETEVFANISNTEISVRVNAMDPEGEVLTYAYEVSGGKIVGQGANVVWNLSGVKPGTYKITARIDDGCGDCAEPKSKTIFVK